MVLMLRDILFWMSVFLRPTPKVALLLFEERKKPRENVSEEGSLMVTLSLKTHEGRSCCLLGRDLTGV